MSPWGTLSSADLAKSLNRAVGLIIVGERGKNLNVALSHIIVGERGKGAP